MNRIATAIVICAITTAAGAQAPEPATTPKPRIGIRERFFPRKATPQQNAQPPVAAPAAQPQVAPSRVTGSGRGNQSNNVRAGGASRTASKPPSPRVRSSASGKAKSTLAKGETSAASGMAAPSGDGGAISSWPTGKNLVALTYDDGPNKELTPQLVALLEEKKVPATFFVLGQSVTANTAGLADLAARGFEVGNHSYTHRQYTKLSADEVRRDLGRTRDIVSSATGGQMSVMRPPYGSHNSQVRRVCDEMGYKVILWDVDTNDWRGRSPQQITDTVMKETRDGSIILMHDRRHKVDGKLTDTVVPATAQIIDGLRAKGFEFVTVSQLLSHPRAGSSGAAPTTAPLTKSESQPIGSVDRAAQHDEALPPDTETAKR